MLLIAMKGPSGSGKSTLSYTLSKHLGWPLIDKDDVRDLLDDAHPEVGGLAYDIMFNIARRQLLQGLNVICDSPLTGSISYEHAQAIATESNASLVVIECICSDEILWRRRINARKSLALPTHRLTDWEKFQSYRQFYVSQVNYPIVHPQFVVDTVQPLHDCLAQVNEWLANLSQESPSL